MKAGICGVDGRMHDYSCVESRSVYSPCPSHKVQCGLVVFIVISCPTGDRGNTPGMITQAKATAFNFHSNAMEEIKAEDVLHLHIYLRESSDVRRKPARKETKKARWLFIY